MVGDRGGVDLSGSIGNFSMLQIGLNSAEVDLRPDHASPAPHVRGWRKSG